MGGDMSRSKVATSLVLGAALVLGSVHSASAAVLFCKNKRGKIAVRDGACKSKETVTGPGAPTAYGSVYLFETSSICTFQGPHSANITVAPAVAGDGGCDITINGVTFDINSHLAVTSAVGTGNFSSHSSVGGNLRLYVKNAAGSPVDAGTLVTFVVIVP
jgi:hypothetical protein